MKRVRFAPNPTGTLHIGDALCAVASRAFGDWMLLRIDDTVPGGEEVVDDLRWLGVEWDELASGVDDNDFGITHVICAKDQALHEALGTKPPEFIQLGQVLGGVTVASLREAGIPAEAVRRYLEELGLPRNDVHYD